MTDKKLNKNQLSFFEEAVKHFGSAAKLIKFGDIKSFAETRGLTVPVSFLKNYCLTGNRAFYDLTQSGIEVAEETGLFALDDEVPEDDVDIYEFDKSSVDVADEPIGHIETPAYANNISGKYVPEIFRTRDPINRTWRNPIYLVSDQEGIPISVCDSPKSAYNKCDTILHGSHSLTEKQAVTAVDKYGVAIVVCTTATSIKAVITKMEMNE